MDARIERVTDASLGHLEALFGSEGAIKNCWCMWFIVSVQQFHQGKAGGNRKHFLDMARSEASPMGLLALLNDEPVGWCAVGPRSRYARALKVPSYRGGPKEDDSKIWLVPCLYVRTEKREMNLGTRLLEAAVDLAREHGALAIEGMPFASGTRRTGGDTQVGFEGLFVRCGFRPVRRPSGTRVVMRRDLNGR